MLKINLSLLLGICFPFFVIAQNDKIETDRPDQTESPYLTPKKWVQLEAGFNVQQNAKNNFDFFSPTLLSKLGISNVFELRIITTLQTTLSKLSNTKKIQTGIQPVEIGGKILICNEKELLPKTSLIFHVAFPKLASKNLAINKVAPNFRFVMQNTISSKLSLGYNVGAEWDGFIDTPSWIYTFAPGYSISNKWYGYIEAFGSVSKNESSQHNIDGGLAYFVNNNLKIDVSGGFGLTKIASDWYFSIGGSIRFNTKSK